MAISNRNANLLEGIGLLLILLSFMIQMVETGIESDIREQENYYIHKKLDHIWAITSHDYAQKYPESGVHSAINFKYYFDDYKIYSQDQEELTEWEKLVKYNWFTNIRLICFILGSFLLILPKFIKTKD